MYGYHSALVPEIQEDTEYPGTFTVSRESSNMGARNQLGSLTRAALFTHIAILTITFSPIHQWVLFFFF